jgi:hypothetical protein
MGYVVLNNGGLAACREHTKKVSEHFRSDAQYEAYLNGLINWDGDEIDEGNYSSQLDDYLDSLYED